MERFTSILVVASGEEAPALVRRAAWIAERNRARLTLFDVVAELPSDRREIRSGTSTIDLQQLIVETRQAELDELAAKVMTVPVRTSIGFGTPFVEIVRHATHNGVDLIVTGLDRLPRRKGLLGSSTTMHLLRKSPVPVWVEPAEPVPSPDVLVAVGPFPDDGGPGELNEKLVQLGTSLAGRTGGVAHIVHAWRLEGETLLRHGRVRLAPEKVDGLVDDVEREAWSVVQALMHPFEQEGREFRVHVMKGSADEVVVEAVSRLRPGVVVMGTLARTGVAGVLIGNTAESVIAELDCGLLSVKPDGFQSPLVPD